MPHQIICLMHLATASSNTLVLLCLEEKGNTLHDQNKLKKTPATGITLIK